VNLDAPNLNAHPLFAFARVWRHVLMPGELLHLPAGTFHFCRNLDPCLSYSRFHLDAVNLPHFYKSYIDGGKHARLRATSRIVLFATQNNSVVTF
jgi:hypothetical protein